LALLSVVSSDEPVLLLFPALVLLVGAHLLLAIRRACRLSYDATPVLQQTVPLEPSANGDL
jgi:hypothetical protein